MKPIDEKEKILVDVDEKEKILVDDKFTYALREMITPNDAKEIEKAILAKFPDAKKEYSEYIYEYGNKNKNRAVSESVKLQYLMLRGSSETDVPLLGACDGVEINGNVYSVEHPDTVLVPCFDALRILRMEYPDAYQKLVQVVTNMTGMNLKDKEGK